MLVPALVVPGGAQVPTLPQFSEVPDRVHVLVMQGNSFNGMRAPDTPVIEGYLGESMLIVVHVPAVMAEPHTFHMHGHPWVDPATGDVIDTVLLNPGQTHAFTVEAGLSDPALVGDWFYHCHMETHFIAGMWGIVRVYPYAMQASGDIDSLTLSLDQLGVPVHGARIDAKLDGREVPVASDALGDGAYQVDLALPPGASGRLVFTTQHTLGESVARYDLTPDGALHEVRGVHPSTLPDAVSEAIDAGPVPRLALA